MEFVGIAADAVSFSATGNIWPAQSYTLGIFVSSASNTPTLTLYDSATTTTSTVVVNTFTPSAGTWYPLPFKYANGIYLVVGGTVAGTVGYYRGANWRGGV